MERYWNASECLSDATAFYRADIAQVVTNQMSFRACMPSSGLTQRGVLEKISWGTRLQFQVLRVWEALFDGKASHGTWKSC